MRSRAETAKSDDWHEEGEMERGEERGETE